MELFNALQEIQLEFSGLNPPATREELSRLEQELGALPEEVSTVYQTHNGSGSLPVGLKRRAVARLMPIDEVIKTGAAIRSLGDRLPAIGRIGWLWTDDNSNYCGIYTDGPLKNWLCVLDHEEQMLTPAFRSISSFLACLLNEARKPDDQSLACDLPSVEREVPELNPNKETAAHDVLIASRFMEQYKSAVDDGIRRLYAFCSICLTPFEKSEDVMQFFQDLDMWIPEAAVRLLEARQWKNGVEELEVLARDGRPNGDSAAMRLLSRMDTEQSRRAIVRLRESLTGQKLRMIEMWTSGRIRVLPPRW